MRIRQIPRHRWWRFLDSFSQQHAGCMCSLEVDSAVAGPEIEAAASPFRGVAYEAGRHGVQVQVFVGDRIDRHLAHSLSLPTAVWLEENDEGAHTGLRIDADEGAIHLRFRSPQPTEYVERFLP